MDVRAFLREEEGEGGRDMEGICNKYVIKP